MTVRRRRRGPAPPLEYDAADHSYSVAGREYVGVTRALNEAGLYSEFTSEPALRRGRVVHKACALLNAGSLDWSSVRHDRAGYVRAWQRAIMEMNIVLAAWEHPVFSRPHGYAGTMDGKGRVGRLPRATIELKTGEPQPTASLQLAAYVYADPDPFPERVVFWLRGDGSYRMRRLPLGRLAQDFDVFLAALKLREWRRENL